MKILVGVTSCARDMENGFNQAVRDTWWRELHDCTARTAGYTPTLEGVFVVGVEAAPLLRKSMTSSVENSDVQILPCPDDYNSLPQKTYALVRHAFDRGFDFLFKCDTDTFVCVEKMLNKSRFFDFDYTGHFNTERKGKTVYDSCYRWASGGSGYWLSRLAMEYILMNPPDERALCPRLKIPCEDLWVGQVLGPRVDEGRLRACHDERHASGYREDFKTKFSSHFCSTGQGRVFDVGWMHAHAEANR